jgi:hypothetical protein
MGFPRLWIYLGTTGTRSNLSNCRFYCDLIWQPKAAADVLEQSGISKVEDLYQQESK